MIAATDLAYAAGIMDGEGTIQLWRRGNLFRLGLIISTCDKYICPWLHKTFGGRLYYRRKHDPTRHPQYFWFPNDKAAGEFLRMIFPFLKLKQDQAQVALRYRYLKDKYCPRGKHNTAAFRRLFARWSDDLKRLKQESKLPRNSLLPPLPPIRNAA